MANDDLFGNQPAPPTPGYAERRSAQQEQPREPYVAPERDIRPYDPAARAREQQGAPPPADGKAAAPGEKVKVGDYELSPEDVAGLLERRAQEDLRKTQIPATAEDYQTKLPDTLKLPDGVQFKFDEADPALAAVRGWAHSQGFSQQQFSELIGHYANSEAQKMVVYNAAAKAEVEKLGAMGTARVTAVETFLRGNVGEELAGHLRGMMVSAKIVEGFEKLMTRYASQGVASFTQSGRDTPAGNGAIPGYENMSFAQQRAAQDAMASRRGR